MKQIKKKLIAKDLVNISLVLSNCISLHFLFYSKIFFLFLVTPPAQRVQFILGEEVGDDAHESHPLFSEMEELIKDGDEMEWKETARYFFIPIIIIKIYE